ncbi:MAG TPA: hypothetical protein VEQ87_02970 [Burkholderiales bacterium]|nr:hypothetical protein [Burkholderiales bacterium]
MLIGQRVQGGALQAVVRRVVVGLAEDDVPRAGGTLEQLLGWNKCAGARVPDAPGERLGGPMGAAEQRGERDGSEQWFRC